MIKNALDVRVISVSLDRMQRDLVNIQEDIDFLRSVLNEASTPVFIDLDEAVRQVAEKAGTEGHLYPYDEHVRYIHEIKTTRDLVGQINGVKPGLRETKDAVFAYHKRPLTSG